MPVKKEIKKRRAGYHICPKCKEQFRCDEPKNIKELAIRVGNDKPWVYIILILIAIFFISFKGSFGYKNGSFYFDFTKRYQDVKDLKATRPVKVK